MYIDIYIHASLSIYKYTHLYINAVHRELPGARKTTPPKRAGFAESCFGCTILGWLHDTRQSLENLCFESILGAVLSAFWDPKCVSGLQHAQACSWTASPSVFASNFFSFVGSLTFTTLSSVACVLIWTRSNYRFLQVFVKLPQDRSFSFGNSLRAPSPSQASGVSLLLCASLASLQMLFGEIFP